jgi:ADP-heptose:LPS heptosyltransferase
MAGIVRRLDAILSVDTGLAHIALALRKPTVVLVGGGHPGRFFPWPTTRDQVVLNVPMPCNGCRNRCHLPDSLCVTDIPPDEIVEAFDRLRKRHVKLDPLEVAA